MTVPFLGYTVALMVACRLDPLFRLLLPVAAAVILSAPPAHGNGAPGSGYLHVSWTEKDGLPGSYIGSMAQDTDGYLWLIANGGLVRFDGVRFVEWAATSPNPLPDIRPSTLHASRSGGLWIGLADEGGIARLFKGRVTLFEPGRGGLFTGAVRAIIEDGQGEVWAAGQAGVARYIANRWEPVGGDQGLPSAPVYSLFNDRKGDLWVGTAVGVFRREGGRFSLALHAIRARGFADDARGGMWMTGLDHPFRSVSNPAEPSLPASLLQNASGGWALQNDSRGNIWVATLGAGVWRVSNAESRSPEIERFDGNRLSSAVVRSLLEDQEGNIWIGTDNGLNRLTPSSFGAQPSDLATINRPVVAMTADSEGHVWVGTQTGLYRFVGDKSLRYDRRDGLPGVAIYALHTDAQGVVWFAGDQLGLVRRERDGRFTAVPLPQTPALRIVALTSDREGALWLCDTDWGVLRWKNGVLSEVMPETTRRAAYSALTDRSGRVWIGLMSRVLLVNPDGTMRLLAADDGIAPGRVTAVFEDSRGTIWAGTGSSLSRFENGRFIATALSSLGRRQSVTAIIEDADANLWLGVMSGIMRIARDELDRARVDPNHSVAHTLYDMSDGLNGAPIWLGFPTAARSGDGRLWFVTSDGLTSIDARTIAKTREPPPVLVEEVTADDRRLAPGQAVALPARTSRLQIDYTGLSFTAPSKVRFRYKLEGFDADWVEAGARRQAFYTNLAPRQYRFRVAASNDGAWNETGVPWEFSIPPAYYQTLWFRTLVLIAVSLAAAAAWRLRVRRVREQYDLVLAERARMGREIHDTLLQGMVGVALQFDAARGRLDPSATPLKKELERLRRQVEFCIREARQSILDLRSPMSPTEELAAAIRAALERQTRGTAVEFELAVTGPPRPCGPRVDQQLLRIAQEAVANAVRHAAATRVSLELCFGPRSVTLTVTDNGRGFDPERMVFTPQDHWGLANMKERADQIGAQFRLTSSPGAGTRIETVVPMPLRAAGAS